MANEAVRKIAQQDYKWGFTSEIDSDVIPAGLNEDVIRMISAKKQEPQWLLDWRLKAYQGWLAMKEPHWANITYPAINYQAIRYYAAPKQKTAPKSMDEVDPEVRKTFEKLGISLLEQDRLCIGHGFLLPACSQRKTEPKRGIYNRLNSRFADRPLPVS